MSTGQFHSNEVPTIVVGTTAQKENYHVLDQENVLVGPAGSQLRANYKFIKCRNGLVYHILVASTPHTGQALQIIPFQDGAGNFPSITYTIEGTIDGVNKAALPTAISGVAVTNAAGPIHLVQHAYSSYYITVTGASNNGYFAVIATH